MNLVKQIMDQLSGDTFGQLGSLLGADAETTERATTAAVPSLLSALAGLARTDEGARKLTNTVGGLDLGSLGNVAQMLGGGASSALNKGSSLLGSLFGDSTTSALAGTLSRFTGLSSSMTKSLLAYLTPLVIGKVASQWKNQGGTAQALKSLFADQREQIASAMPAGLSLADIPGTSEVRETTYSTARKTTAPVAAPSSPALWLIPAALALLAGLFLWNYFSRQRANQVVAEKVTPAAQDVTVMKPVLPSGIDDATLGTVRNDLGGLFKSLNTSLSDIRDPASAERAMPALREMNTKIDTIDQVLARLPDATRSALRPTIEEQAKVAIEKANAASAVNGIGAEFKALIQQIVTKISKWVSADNR
jgi:Bacterial protein of unknown function (DUF937)